MKKYAGEEFLNRLYKDLVHSDEVKRTAKGANKNEDLAIYLEILERITNEVHNKDRLDLLKYFYYKKYIIKEENIPESYFTHQVQLAFERGYGHIEYDDRTKNEEINIIISEQKESLDRWLNYFVSEETNYYPMWFKYYVFQNIMKIGYFDKEKNVFTKRTVTTVKPFIEINREAIAMLYDEIYKYLDKQDLTDAQLEQLIKNGNFNKIYSYIIRKLDRARKSTSTSNEGIWKKYEQGSNPKILFNDIHGKGTGWCTAGGLKTAETHLEGGDFHVYYTKDENGEYTNPRIAIRMELGKIAEIRGIAENQNLENEMEGVVEKKLQEFPDKDEYEKKVSDMKKLTKIYNKHKNKEELSKEELRFLYEIDSKIIGFGYSNDPRIEEIIKNRETKKDLECIFSASENEISLTNDEAVQGNIKCHYGNLSLGPYLMEKKLGFPEYVIGDFSIEWLVETNSLILPKVIMGDLILSSLETVDELILPEKVYGNIDLKSLTNVNKIVFPKEIGGSLDLHCMKDENIILPEKVGDSLSLGTCSNQGLVLPKYIGDSVFLKNLQSAEGLEFPEKIYGNLDLGSLNTAIGLNLPYEIEGYLGLDNLESAEGLILPKKVCQTIFLQNLKNAQGIMLPRNENGDFYIPSDDIDCPFPEQYLIYEAKQTYKRENNIVKKLIKKLKKSKENKKV